MIFWRKGIMLEEIKRKRGRPVKGKRKTRQLNVRVPEEFYDEFVKLCAIDGETQADYIMKSVRTMRNLTLLETADRNKNESVDDIYDRWYDEEEEDYDE